MFQFGSKTFRFSTPDFFLTDYSEVLESEGRKKVKASVQIREGGGLTKDL